jgi:agmatine deiminase
MRLLLAVLLFAPLAILATPEAQAQDLNPEWFDLDPMPKAMTPEEERDMHLLEQFHERTAPPASPMRNIAEFERNEAVLIRFPLGIPLELVASMSEHVQVVTIVNGTTQQNQATSAFQSAGVDMTNVDFMHAPTNSMWTRDYGPFYGADEDGSVSIVNFTYDRPHRPQDNQIPAALASHWGVPYYSMDIVHTGGNYMTDGRGISASTEILWSTNNHNQTHVLQQMGDFLGIETYYVTIDPQAPGIGHIDTWAKYLDVDKIIIAQVPPNHPHHEKLELVTSYFEQQLSGWGTPYQIFRVYAPGGEPYTNSLIVNERVYVPLMWGSNWNTAAIESFQEALPGYEVLGFYHVSGGQNLWLSSDALHCRVKEIPDKGMLHIGHLPLMGTQPLADQITLLADVIPYSGEPLVSDSLALYYSINDLPYQRAPLAPVSGDTFAGAIPLAPGAVDIAYYFTAADASGRSETFPLIGAPGARTFQIEHSTTEQQLQAGWQMVSLPLARTHTDYRQIYAAASDDGLLGYGQDGYTATTTLDVGAGYWLQMDEAATVTIAGTEIEDQTITLTEGWNLISAPHQAIDAGAIEDPAGVVIDHTLYAFDGVYTASATFEPGQGYWLRASGDGQIAVSTAAGGQAAGAVPDLPYEAFHALEIAGGAGAYTLYLGADLGDFEGDARSFGLPPAPPAGLFDARLDTYDWLTTAFEATVLLQHGAEPVALTPLAPDGIDATYVLSLFAGEELQEVRELASGEQTSLAAQIDRIEVAVMGDPTDAEDGAGPVAFALEQNFPNPVVGSAQIDYAVAEAVDVRIEVFSITGQRVATLVDAAHASGTYSVTLDAAELASGTYIYRMTAGAFVATRRLLVVH